MEEQPRLIALPDNPFPCNEIETVRVGKTPYVRFDLNDYSVPHTHVRQALSIQATLDSVSILDGAVLIAKHQRSYDKAKQIECAEHIKTLADRKRAARLSRSQDRLIQSIDCARDFLNATAAHGYSLRATTNHLTSLLDDYGASLLEQSMAEALAKKVPHSNSVQLILQRLRDESQEKPLAVLALSKDKRITDMIVKPHSLNQYEVLNKGHSNEEESC